MTITLHYSVAIFRRAIAQYLGRYIFQQWLTLMLLVVSATVAFFSGSIWLEAFLALPLIALPAIFALGYWLRICESLKRFQLLEDGKVEFSIDNEGTKIVSAIGKSESKWKIYTDLWEFSDSFLLFYGSGQFITLPKDQVPTEMIGFIKTKVMNGTSHQRRS